MRSSCHLLGVLLIDAQDREITISSIPFLVYRSWAKPNDRCYMAKPVTNAALLEEKKAARTRGLTAHD
jgi:hypothetical protein